ncbi:type IX secretion system membrane protein PorP/SprF [Cytophagaceae bacterium ABcell3]|nr:type IX secretion system membrane protein PorP/SprF [Cytophagaceae bacterium ABcell3]
MQAKAQSPQFSQYYANALYPNPAFAGADYTSIFASRYQWHGLAASYFSNTTLRPKRLILCYFVPHDEIYRIVQVKKAKKVMFPPISDSSSYAETPLP